MAVKPIALSFKNTAEDLELYEWISSHSNMSGFIKDILRGEMMKGGNKDILITKEEKQTGLIDMDF